jgi:hypothetical protein
MTFSLLTEYIKPSLIISSTKGCLYLSQKEYGNDFFKMSPKELVKFLKLCSLFSGWSYSFVSALVEGLIVHFIVLETVGILYRSVQ